MSDTKEEKAATAAPAEPTPAAPPATPAEPAPQKLSPNMVYAYNMLIAFALICMVVGGCGLAILSDEKKTRWISKTEFARIYWLITSKFHSLTGMLVNGGLMTLIVSAKRLQEHARARKIEVAAERAALAAAEASGSDTKDEEPKKDK